MPDFVFLCQLPAPKSIQDVQFFHDRHLHKLYFRFDPFPSLMVMPAIRGNRKYSSIDQHTDNNGLRARLCLPLPATDPEKYSGCSIYSRPVPSQTLFPVRPISLPYGIACNPGGGWETQHWLTRQEHRTSCQTLSSSASYRLRKVFRMFNLFTTGAFTNFISGSTHFPTLW